MNSPFAPDSSESELFTLETAKGRRHLFQKRLDELMRPPPAGRGLSLDDAIYEMRTGGNPDDVALLEAMGEKVTPHRTEQLRTERFNERLNRQMEDNKDALKTSAEVAAVLAKNERSIAFNARITELTDRGFSIDQAIAQMRANADDAALLKAMGAAFST